MHRQRPQDESELFDSTAEAADSSDLYIEDAADLQAVERLLASFDHELPDPFVLPKRHPAAQREESQVAAPALQAWAMQPLPNMPSTEARGGFLAWLFLAGGLMAFACGAVMLGWSVAAGRDDLWSLGIPLALGGQGAIIFGLLGLVEAAGQRQKAIATALEEHRQRLTMMQNLALVSPSTTTRRAA